MAAERGGALNGALHVLDADFDAALGELIYGGGELTRNLLGFAAAEDATEEASAG